MEQIIITKKKNKTTMQRKEVITPNEAVEKAGVAKLIEHIVTKPPVENSQILVLSPSGFGAHDPFYSLEGYIIFIKECPANWQQKMRVRITNVRQTYAFAIFLEVIK